MKGLYLEKYDVMCTGEKKYSLQMITSQVDAIAMRVDNAARRRGDLNDGGGLIVVRDSGDGGLVVVRNGGRGRCKHSIKGRVNEVVPRSTFMPCPGRIRLGIVNFMKPRIFFASLWTKPFKLPAH